MTTKLDRRRLERWLTRNKSRLTGLRRLLPLAGQALGGFLFPAAALAGGPLPLGAVWILGADLGAGTLISALSACLGYWHFWGRAGLASIGVSLCLLLAAVLFDGSTLSREPVFYPALACAATAVLELAVLLGSPAVPLADFGRFALRSAAAAGGTWLFRRSWTQWGTWADQCSIALGVLALSQLLLFRRLDLGFFAAGLLTALPLERGALGAALCGGALELSGVTRLPMGAVLCLAAFAGRHFRRPRRQLLPAALTLGAMALTGNFDLTAPISLLLGGCAALLVRDRPQGPAVPPPDTVQLARLHLEQAAQTLELLHGLLAAESAPRPADAEVFDLATERVCRGCVRWGLCWEEQGDETYQALRQAAPGILSRRTATWRDLPETFRNRCSQTEAFLRSVNDALDRLRASRGRSVRLGETRRALKQQYRFLADFLGDTARELEEPPCPQTRYRPAVGVCSVSRLGQNACGDKGAHFPGPEGQYYVLLCDGMGTGLEAAREGEDALHILTGLLQAGLPPEQALEMLNSLYVLRESGAFSTVDLLELRLDTGRGALYKWGGAPSYLKTRSIAKKLGTAGPPPGLGIGNSCHAEVIRLSLQRGQTVVLVSDGAGGEEVKQRIAAFDGQDPRALAAHLVAGAKEGEDDATAVAVTLRPLVSTTE